MSKYRKECWTDADVRCPFYISDERSARSITCEGCMEETKVTMSFRTLANRDGHMGRFCVGTYEHNNFARRVPVVEEQIRVMDRRMTALEKYKD